MLEFSILNFDFSLAAQYIVVGAMLHVFFVVLFLVSIIIIEKKKILDWIHMKESIIMFLVLSTVKELL